MTKKEMTSLSITTSDQDLLSRENIVTAITNKIVERSQGNIHCEVIGVYSKWGEGKTSVLNLVKEQLKKQKEKMNVRLDASTLILGYLKIKSFCYLISSRYCKKR